MHLFRTLRYDCWCCAYSNHCSSTWWHALMMNPAVYCTAFQEPSVALAIQMLDGAPLRIGGNVPLSVMPAKFEQKGEMCWQLCTDTLFQVPLCCLNLGQTHFLVTHTFHFFQCGQR